MYTQNGAQTAPPPNVCWYSHVLIVMKWSNQNHPTGQLMDSTEKVIILNVRKL
jgi:hypothetical protein